jgi:hypothetical protein
MKQMTTFKRRINRTTISLGLSCLILLLSLITPLFGQKVHADSSGATEVNLPTIGTHVTFSPPLKYGSCVGSFSSQRIDGTFLQQHFYKDINALIGGNPAKESIETYVGYLDGRGSATDAAAIHYVVSEIGQTVPVITFHQADGINAKPGDDVAGPFNDGENNNHSNLDTCGGYLMFPISKNEWRGYEATNDARGETQDGRNLYMSFTQDFGQSSTDYTTGTFVYQFPQNNVLNYMRGYTDKVFRMGGVPPVSPPGGGGAGDIYHAQFINVRQIKITDGPYKGEIYQKNQWGGDANYSNNSFWFLTQDTAVGDRSGLAAGTECLDPLPWGSVCKSDTSHQNGVPFIDVPFSFDMSHNDPGLNQLNGRAGVNGSLATQNYNSVLYDYNNDGTIAQTHAIVVDSNTQYNASVWLFYSAQNDAFMPVFVTGSGNEQVYLTVYKKSGSIYKGGTGGCNGTISGQLPVGPTLPAPNMSTVKWTLYSSDCVTAYGTFNVRALGGAAGEAGFAATSAQAAGDLPTPSEPKIGCDSLGGPLNWITCPVIDLMTATVKVLDATITDLLTINPDQFFNDNNPTGLAYHQAWSVFRTFAIAIILIAALAMVLGQALGVEIASAYTIRKMLPVLIMTILAISVLWQLCKDVTIATNEISASVRSILYIPFAKLSGQGVNLNNLSTTIGALFLVGGALAYGIFGLLSLAVTAIMAVLVAYALLVLRLILFAAWLMTGPFALALGIVWPKARKIWIDTGVGIFFISIMWSMVIAVGNDFSITALAGSQNAAGGTKTLWQVVALGVYYGKYFVFFVIVRAASGLMATIGGFVNDRSRGAFDRVKGYRRQTLAKRGQKFTSGSLFRDNRLARPLNAVGRRIGAAQAGAGIHAFSPFQRGQQARALYDSQLADQTLKNNPLLHELQNNDDANNVLGMSGGTMAGLQAAARDLFTNENGVYDRRRANSAMAAARAAGVNRANSLAAMKTSMQNKARGFSAGNVRALDRGVRRLARSEAEYQSFGHQAAFFARSNGRADLGGTDWISYRRNNDAWQTARATQAAARAGGASRGQAEMQGWQALADVNMSNGIERMSAQAIVSGHDNQVIQSVRTLTRQLATSTDPRARLDAAIALKELQGNLPAGASGGVRDAINSALYNSPTHPTNPGLGLQYNTALGGTIANQLAQWVGMPDVDGDVLTTMGRTYTEYASQQQQQQNP